MPVRRKPLKYRDLLKKLKPFGVIEIPWRGKGSESILLRPSSPRSRKGAQYTVKCHGKGDEISIPVINAILRRFSIPPVDFWRD